MKKRPTKKSRTILVDGDIILYQQAFVNSKSVDWGDGIVSEWLEQDMAYAGAKEFVFWLKELVHATDILVMVTGGKNFRRDLNPNYKLNRKDKEKPKLLDITIQALNDNFTVISEPKLEADDLLGLYATDSQLCGGDKIICSIDKDMMTLPVQIYNWNRTEMNVIKVNPIDAEYRFFLQTLMGDPVDGYHGIPKVGPKKAQDILNAAIEEGIPLWDAVANAYISRGLTIEDALLNARMAYILRAGDYDFKTHEVRLWNP